MQPVQDHFPVFEANQVLTSGHLNTVFNYLDEQARLTRANLIGIGIVCGLDIGLSADGSAIALSKGCGITSEGYLLVEPEDASLVAYRTDYVMPSDPDYPAFRDAATQAQYPLWELFAAGEPNTTPLNGAAGFLEDKAALLFLELKKQGLRNCSPNNCDDKGSEVTASVKRLLIRRDDLDKIIAAANALGQGLTSGDLASALLSRLNLPDLRLPRFDVLNTNPVTSGQIYAAFLKVFQTDKLAQATGDALDAAYAAFKPLLEGLYPASPFGDFKTSFGFLDEAPATTGQVRFLQHYVDLFDDLLRAYDDFRWKAVELVCACCPPEGLFSRHMMLGLPHPEKASQPGIYRQDFLAAPAVSGCAEGANEVLQLFQRLVEMTRRFTYAPDLPKANDKAQMDPQIRITPSTLGEQPLSEKAIPYYYRQNGAPPLYRLWSPQKTRRNRAHQNLAYRYDEYTPAAPVFVSHPLRYDLEPHNFLRIEGHLGKHYRQALGTLLLLRSQYRLPVEFIALRSGAYDDTQAVDLRRESARFQDLEALYDVLREELLSSLAEGVRYLYDTPLAGSTLPGGTPGHALLKTHAPTYRYPAGTLGAWYEKYLALFQFRPYIDVDQNQIDSNAVLTVYCALFTGTTDLPQANFAHAVSIYYFSKLAEILPASLDALGYADFENKYQDLLGLVRFFRSEAVSHISAEFKGFVPQEDLIDHFDHVLFSCKLDAVRSVHDEYVSRIGGLKKKQFLANFLQMHPGLQHKAGVPLGGTFILVYHQDAAPNPGLVDGVGLNVAALAEAIGTRPAPGTANTAGLTGAILGTRLNRANTLVFSDAIGRIGSDSSLLRNPDIRFVLGSLTGVIPIGAADPPAFGLSEPAARIVSAAIDELADGTVIADFYLPYLIASDAAPVQFVLPKAPPAFEVRIGCPNADGMTSVTLAARGGVPPYELRVDDQAYQTLDDAALLLAAGTHALTIRDAESIESAMQSVMVPAAIAFGTPDFKCSEDSASYTATVQIRGGTPPYRVNGAALEGNLYTSEPIPSRTAATLDVLDSNQCVGKTEFTHNCCDLPCAGIALRRGYRFWLPEPFDTRPYTRVSFELMFSLEFPQGQSVDLSAQLLAIVQAVAVADLNANFTEVVQRKWIEQINQVIADKTGKPDWLKFAYEPDKPGTLGILRIEYFECLKFHIRIASFFNRSEVTEVARLEYGPEGTMIDLRTGDAGGEPVLVPAFDTVRIDKCDPQRPEKPLRAEAPDVTLRITRRVKELKASLKATPAGAEEPVAYLWEVQGGSPAMVNGQSAEFTFASAEPPSRPLRLTAFTQDGYRVVKDDKIDLR